MTLSPDNASSLSFSQNRGVELFVTHLRSGPRKMFERAGIEELLGSDAFFDTLGDVMTRGSELDLHGGLATSQALRILSRPLKTSSWSTQNTWNIC